ncbi:MAG: carbohydrate kinase family protein [Myxococcales bacterium]|nr:carbohydrate kinase family protein [Myxococcota bacterium]MDW8283318.1 carbohydrate kinase family protein [Myxococcales bacterium]
MSRLRRPEGSTYDVIGLGECSLDETWRLQEAGPPLAKSKIAARGRDLLGGGQVATAMVACRRLGLRAAFLGAVGGDEAGRIVLQGLRDEGVDTSAVRVLPTARTRCALVLVQPGGERTVIEQRDPELVLHAAEIQPAMVGCARVLHVDATHLGAAICAALHARAQHTLVSVDVDRLEQGVEHLVRLADLCIVPEHFPQLLTGERHFERAVLQMTRRTEGLVIVTLGERGCVAVDREERERLVYCPAFPVSQPVDTTACGDTFHAAAIAYLLDGAERSSRPLEGLLRFANAAAALKCRALGRRGCPTRSEVEALLGSEAI